MAHQRTVIRLAVCAALSAGVASVETRVHGNRFLPMRRRDLPAVLVYATKEAIEEESKSSAPRELVRQLELVVEGLVEDADGESMSAALDDLAGEIEAAMHADETFGGACADCILDSTEIGHALDGDRELGSVQLTYTITYQTLAPEPPADEDLDEFLTVGATENLGNAVHPDEVAQDVFDVREVEGDS